VVLGSLNRFRTGSITATELSRSAGWRFANRRWKARTWDGDWAFI